MTSRIPVSQVSGKEIDNCGHGMQFVVAVGEGVSFVVVNLVVDFGPVSAQSGGDRARCCFRDARVPAALNYQQRGLDLAGMSKG